MPFCIHKEICFYRWFQHCADFSTYSAATLDHETQDHEKNLRKKINEFLGSFTFPLKKNYIHPPFLPSLQQIPLMFKIRLFFSRFLFSCQRVTHCQIDLITITDLVLLVLQGKTRKHKGKGQYRKTLQVRIC